MRGGVSVFVHDKIAGAVAQLGLTELAEIPIEVGAQHRFFPGRPELNGHLYTRENLVIAERQILASYPPTATNSPPHRPPHRRPQPPATPHGGNNPID